MNVKKSICFVLVAIGIAGAASAQSDPKLQSTVDPEPMSVSLSRDSADPAFVFVARAAYRVKINNAAATYLNRALFSASSSVVEATSEAPVAGAVAPFDAGIQFIHVAGENANCVVGGSDLTAVSCDFGDGQLAPGDTSEFLLVVKSPFAGARIKVSWSFGGAEGNGGGNGCCTKVESTYTTLIDPVADPAQVNRHAQSFMVQNVLGKIFTGVRAGQATASDPWTTVADLGNAYTVNGQPQSYTQATLDEVLSLQSCSALQQNACWSSTVTIPSTQWTVANPLRITLQRHSSIIKNGSKLSNYFIQYRATEQTAPVTLQQCSIANPPEAGKPCLDGPCQEIALPTKPPTFIWSCQVNALDNGKYDPL